MVTDSGLPKPPKKKKKKANRVDSDGKALLIYLVSSYIIIRLSEQGCLTSVFKLNTEQSIALLPNE